MSLDKSISLSPPWEDVCPNCGGTGKCTNPSVLAKYPSEAKHCSRCEGCGRIKECDECDGYGESALTEALCWKCDGSGEVDANYEQRLASGR